MIKTFSNRKVFKVDFWYNDFFELIIEVLNTFRHFGSRLPSG